ncbi:signal peptidase I [Acidimicrobiaceae bacterium USS-CC1]|uniref:Signal peptidase I n=1 Tax=Acidiferrimicrobium australe TaxID=2664430 RepID=A0ABW9QTK4_9ACTN|nr:signal peptidase I [Acidiferrimicrobium australe]
MRKILIRVGLGLLAAVFALCAYVSVLTNHVYVTTPSMYPTIPPGSLVFIQPQKTYRVGDVIEFHGNGLVFMHRIIRINRLGDITTKGDNPENVPDVFARPVTKADVIGKEVLAIPYVGFPELILHRPGYGLAWLRAELGFTGRLILIGAVALLTCLYSWVAGRAARVALRRRADLSPTPVP